MYGCRCVTIKHISVCRMSHFIHLIVSHVHLYTLDFEIVQKCDKGKYSSPVLACFESFRCHRTCSWPFIV